MQKKTLLALGLALYIVACGPSVEEVNNGRFAIDGNGVTEVSADENMTPVDPAPTYASEPTQAEIDAEARRISGIVRKRAAEFKPMECKTTREQTVCTQSAD